jgi:hypothetical protein
MIEPPRPDGLPLPDDAVDAYAAGELSDADAEAVRALAARDRGLADRLEAAGRVEAALRAQEPAPLPLGLVAATLARVYDTEGAGSHGQEAFGGSQSGAPEERPALRDRWGRVAIAAAAAVALAVGGWRLLADGGSSWAPRGWAPTAEVVASAPLPRVPSLPDVSGWSIGAVDAFDSAAAGPAAILATLLGVGIAVGRAAGSRPRESETRCAG